MMNEKLLTDAEKGILALLRLKQHIASSSSSSSNSLNNNDNNNFANHHRADDRSISLRRIESQTTRTTRKRKAEEDIEGEDVVAATSTSTNKQKLVRRVKQKARKTIIQKARKRKVSGPLPPPPPLPPMEYVSKITNEMGGINIQLVIQKYLTDTDLKKDQGRLSMLINKIQAQDFLTNEEKEFLKTRKPENSKSCSDIEIGVIDVNLNIRKETLRLRKWVSGKNSPMYVLGTHWNEVVIDNKLKADDIIQVWSFRVETKLHFALVKVIVPQQQQQQ